MRITQLIFALSILCSSASFAQDPALQRLDDSPRHHEWVAIPQGDRSVHAFVAYPESEKKTPAVIVIHENRGLNDWVRSVADRLAEHGYLAIAPDLLSGMGPEGGKTSDFPDSDAAREALYQLPPDQITADLKAVSKYVLSLPAANGTISVAGFCWGGSQSFRFATSHVGLQAAFVFYGTGPTDPGAIDRITAPVYGFYGGDDARVNATIPESQKLMKAAGKTYEPVTYEDAGHGFMRRGESAPAADPNARAHEAAWDRWLSLLATP